MGLTIHYGLSLPIGTPVGEVRSKLNELRQRCLDLPFQEVGGMIDLQGDDADYQKTHDDNDNRWFLIQARGNLLVRDDYQGVVVVDDFENSNSFLDVMPKRVIGFATWPGEGCESANVGMCWYPKTVERMGHNGRKFRLKVPPQSQLCWKSFCKTQYASQVSIQHFLQCHLTVVAMLDAAKQIGFNVEVNDEGGYWETRNLKALSSEIGTWNEFVAAIAGQLKDKMGDEGELIAPIMGYKDFERLELAGQQQLSKVIKLTSHIQPTNG